MSKIWISAMMCVCLVTHSVVFLPARTVACCKKTVLPAVVTNIMNLNNYMLPVFTYFTMFMVVWFVVVSIGNQEFTFSAAVKEQVTKL